MPIRAALRAPRCARARASSRTAGRAASRARARAGASTWAPARARCSRARSSSRPMPIRTISGPGSSASLVPLRAYQLVSEPLSENLRAAILPERQLLTDTRRLYAGVRLRADGRLQMSVDGPPFSIGGRANIAKAERRIRKLFPQIGNIALGRGMVRLGRHDGGPLPASAPARPRSFGRDRLQRARHRACDPGRARRGAAHRGLSRKRAFPAGDGASRRSAGHAPCARWSRRSSIGIACATRWSFAVCRPEGEGPDAHPCADHPLPQREWTMRVRERP